MSYTATAPQARSPSPSTPATGASRRGRTGNMPSMQPPAIGRRFWSKHPTLRLDFAHFGSGNPEWVRQILDLMTRYPNVYADLACYTNAQERSEAWRIWNQRRHHPGPTTVRHGFRRLVSDPGAESGGVFRRLSGPLRPRRSGDPDDGQYPEIPPADPSANGRRPEGAPHFHRRYPAAPKRNYTASSAGFPISPTIGTTTWKRIPSPGISCA